MDNEILEEKSSEPDTRIIYRKLCCDYTITIITVIFIIIVIYIIFR